MLSDLLPNTNEKEKIKRNHTETRAIFTEENGDTQVQVR